MFCSEAEAAGVEQEPRESDCELAAEEAVGVARLVEVLFALEVLVERSQQEEAVAVLVGRLVLMGRLVLVAA